jgi:hypothetical protein
MSEHKQDVIKMCPRAYCKRDNNGRFYIFVDRINPVFPSGHASSRKAWEDLAKELENRSFMIKDVKGAII